MESYQCSSWSDWSHSSGCVLVCCHLEPDCHQCEIRQRNTKLQVRGILCLVSVRNDAVCVCRVKMLKMVQLLILSIELCRCGYISAFMTGFSCSRLTSTMFLILVSIYTGGKNNNNLADGEKLMCMTLLGMIKHSFCWLANGNTGCCWIPDPFLSMCTKN